MTRYRLRFLLQEFDLPRGTTLIGRSSECQVTIEDPLVSRQHARIVIDTEGAAVEDLGSRNGVKVNGLPIRGTVPLKDGDRLRIGTQELVFCRAETSAHASAKTTGFLRHCGACRLPYPKEIGACPSCGATDQIDEETLSGHFGATSQGMWSVQLLIEVLDKALSLGRVHDAERILRRATAAIEERVLTGERIDPKHLEGLSVSAARLSIDASQAVWGAWVAQIHRRMAKVPAAPVIDALGELVAKFPEDVGGAIDELAASCRATVDVLPAEDAARLARLEQLRAAVCEGGRRASVKPGPNPTLS